MATHITLNVEAGVFGTDEIPDKLVARQREHIKLLPTGAVVLMGKFTHQFNPNIVVIHSNHTTATECKYSHLTSRE